MSSYAVPAVWFVGADCPGPSRAPSSGICGRLQLAFLPCVFPIGYCNDLPSRDSDLAKGRMDTPWQPKHGNLERAPDACSGKAADP